MNLKNTLLLVPLALTSFSVTFLGCTQSPSSPQKEKPTVAISSEESGRLINAQPEPDTLKGSLKADAQGKIGAANVKISYHSPAVRGRVVWGGLVPYDQVWVTGAHKATRLETDKELSFGGKKIPAGKYALFTVPGKNEWIIVINKNWQQHLTDNYSDKEDLLRLNIRPEIQQQNQERLRYEIVSGTGKTGELVMTWEKLKITIPVRSE